MRSYSEKQVKVMMETEGITRQQAIAELQALVNLDAMDQEANHGMVVNGKL